MIQKKNIYEIGKILKPYGVGGELTVLYNKPEFADIASDFYFFELEGTYIPFFVEELSFNSDITARIKFEEIDTIEQASSYNNILLFLPNDLVNIKEVNNEDELSSTWDQFIGFTVIDEDSTLLGTIKEVDSTTINVLFIVIKESKEFLIPATNDFIVKVDSEEKVLQLRLPEGLLDDE
ncbi:MAG: ribosome maturation factor RimM [Dysgonamonadaceae bacterium]|jgi:16S rRNA processing protein RimM|nr:ribosome maturation factor RimM [Dysgonamonadaceae bacterium]